MTVAYRLDRTVVPVAQPPPLDAEQQRVVDHPGGPLLVLAGPGTGKTTTLVEAVVDRVERRGLDPSRVLVLTFGRKAAEELRDRVTARLQRTTAAPMSSTFHSFCYALLRSCQPADEYAEPLRLLSSPEQDVRLRELLTHSRESGRVQWPDGLSAALRTRGFAREVQSVLARTREVGLEPDELSRLGAEAGRPAWAALGEFMEEYLEVLDFEGALDYAELIHRAVLLAESPDVRADLRRRFAAVFVDEYQDSDPGQVRLLQAIAGDGRDLVVVGDPDQSIYAFRGADVRGILDFPTAFPCADGTPAPVVALSTTRRFGDRLLTASRRVASGISVAGSIDADRLRRFRNPTAAPGDHGPGHVEVLLCSSVGAESEHIADLVRRAHLADGVPWSQIAVLVRSGRLSIPRLRRALGAAGVPVIVAGDELPLRSEPAVQPLLTALAASVNPQAITAETARALALSPLTNVDAAGLRRLARELRRRQREETGHPESSAELIRAAVVDPLLLADVGLPAARGVRRLGELIGQAHRELESGATAEEALWLLWQGTGWPGRLRAQVEAGGPAARSADRDLDAVCALFDAAARAEERQQHTSVETFLAELAAQQIPADSRFDGGTAGDGVRLLTAHRAKGLEWRLVVVAGVQEGSWPDTRRRGTLLQADRLAADGLREPPTLGAMLAEERRLFYVAVTRAREQLVVTAVSSAEQDGDQPSRFVTDLDVRPITLPGRPERPLTLTGLVAALRRTCGDPDASPSLRAAAAARLARLAGERVGERALVPAADPAHWWGMRARTTAEPPVRPADEPLRLSGSALEGLLECPLKWFLSHEAGGDPGRSSAMGFGSVIHALADHLASTGDVTKDELIGLLDTVWAELGFESPWIATRERVEAELALDRLLAWDRHHEDRTPLGSEVPFDVTVALGADSVHLRGRVDRLESDADGALHIVDFKTTKKAPFSPQVEANPQLGCYQLAADNGAFAEVAGDDARSGGAELVQLRVDAGGLPKVQKQPPQQPGDDGRTLIETQLQTAAEAVRAELFPAQENSYCRRCAFRSCCPVQVTSGTVLS